MTNSSETDFLIPGAKEVFIHLQNTFIKAPIFYNFDSEHYIYIEINALGYIICRVPSQMTSDQSSSGHVSYKYQIQLFEPISKVGQ